MSIDFARIRSHRGSQHHGFEELCCQLAGAELQPAGSRFVRNAAPDAGVECYWLLPGGEEHGWQAKYFQQLGKDQLRQLDESVKTALHTHDRLTRYVVCLPFDLPDGRVRRQASQRTKWEDWSERWREFARQGGRSLQIDLWGEHELHTRLAEDAHAGRRMYWFGGPAFSPDWFASRLSETVESAGARYTPGAHIDLPLTQTLDALAYTSTADARLRDAYDEVRQHWTRIGSLRFPSLSREEGQSPLAALGTACEAAFSTVASASVAAPPDAESVKREFAAAAKSATALRLSLRSLHHDRARKSSPHQEDFDYQASRLSEFASELSDFAADAAQPEMQLLSRPRLLLTGPAGSGKTHALCDAADRHLREGAPALCVLASQLGGGDPWSGVIRRLALSCSRDELLGALQSAAQAAGGRGLILIDALNENLSINWLDELPAMLEVLKRYDRLALAVSCRTVYQEDVVRDDVLGRFIRVEHPGFAGVMEQAALRYADVFGVDELRLPILSNEFSSPLFLMLFCNARKAGSPVRRGRDGLTTIFDAVLEGLEARLHRRERLDYHHSARRAVRGLGRVAELMLEAEDRWLPIEGVLEELGRIHPETAHSESLYAALIGEGFLIEQTRYGQPTESRAIVGFAYDRLGDHLVASQLLRSVRNAPASESERLLNHFLGRFVPRLGTSGLVAAACELAPALLGCELYEAVPRVKTLPRFQPLFLSSLVGRSFQYITPSALDYVAAIWNGGSLTGRRKVLETALQAAATPEHPLNARWLHDALLPLSLPQRDVVWSTFLHELWEYNPSLLRIIDWAWPTDCEDRDPAASADPETVRLAALCLGWFLSTPNRFVRDRATKAIVSLLHRRLDAAAMLVRELGSVNDPYVVERVLAAAYGCSMRSADAVGLRSLAVAVYETVFVDQVPFGVLTRDYARGCIERAGSLSCLDGAAIDLARTRPPYGSRRIGDAPSWQRLRESYPESQFGDLHSKLHGIMSDFVSYVLTTPRLHRVDAWTALSRPPEPPVGDVKRLTDRELQTLIDALGPHPAAAEPALPESALSQQEAGDDSDDDGSDVEPRMRDWRVPADCRGVDFASRWIFQRVVELGWTSEQFGEFDREVLRHDRGRSPTKPERVGKKYQWIALHEYLGRLLDQQPFSHRRWSGDVEPEIYAGAWQLELRDIDPALLDRGRRHRDGDVQPSSWWVPGNDPSVAEPELDDRDWIRSVASLPELTQLASARTPNGGPTWSTLALSAGWMEPRARRETRLPQRRREVSFTWASWLVPSSKQTQAIRSIGRWEFNGGDLSGATLWDSFIGECYWSESVADLTREVENGWTGAQDDGPQFKRLNGTGPTVATTFHQFHRGNGSFDCSMVEGVGSRVPSAWLAAQLGIVWARRGFQFCSATGEVIAYDPSTEFDGPSALLVRRDQFKALLDRQRLTLIIAVVGEKNAYSPATSAYREDDWPGRLVFRRALTDDGSGAVLRGSQSLFHGPQSCGRSEVLEATGCFATPQDRRPRKTKRPGAK